MKTASVILAHPYPESFNHAIFKRVLDTLESKEIHTFRHDLYKEGFNPVLTRGELGKELSKDLSVIRYSKELIESDFLIFIHPNWWGMPPAIMKGYIDRVIRPPFAYDFPMNDSGGGLPIGKLEGKTGLVFNTSNTEAGREDNYFGDPLQNIWEKCVFGFCGIENCRRKMFRIIADSSFQQREKWLEEVEKEVKKII